MSSPSVVRSLAPLAVVAGLVASCGGGGAGGERPSVLLITLDTTRADALGCYGQEAPVTPHLDRLAREGVVFERAFTVVPLTQPSHASMLTGLYPPRHSVRSNSVTRLPEAAETLAERAREAGYQTAAFVAAAVLDPEIRFDQGFDAYEAPRPRLLREDSFIEDRPGREVVDDTLAWWRARDPARPAFVWAHFFDPHAPHDAPAELLERAGGDDYLAEVAEMDAEIGRLLDALRADGSLDRTVVLVAGDHGESRSEHREVTHGVFVYQATLHVPLILRRHDGERAGERSRDLVSVVDVHPTLTEAMGLPARPGLDGFSLWARPVPAGRGVYFESYYTHLSYGWSPLAGWADAEGKYVHSSDPELYDLGADPREQRNVLEARATELERYRAAILDVTERPVLERSASEKPSPELQARLQALGYVGVDASTDDLPHPLAPTEAPSPRNVIDLHLRSQYGQSLANTGSCEEAVEVLKPLVEADPGNNVALRNLVFCLMRLGRHEEALEPLERGIAVRQTADLACYHGACLMATGRDAQALQAFLATLEMNPDHVPALALIGDLLRRMGRKHEAVPYDRRRREIEARNR